MVDYLILFVLVTIPKSSLSFRRLFVKNMGCHRGCHVHFYYKQYFYGRGTYAFFIWANISAVFDMVNPQMLEVRISLTVLSQLY